MSDILFWYSISCVVAFVLLTVAFISHERSRSDLDKCINGEREYSDPTYHTTLISALEELNERIKKDKFTKCKDIKDIITQQKAINKQFLKDMKKYENSKNA